MKLKDIMNQISISIRVQVMILYTYDTEGEEQENSLIIYRSSYIANFTWPKSFSMNQSRKGHFAKLVERATDTRWSPAVVKSGFSRAGLVPFNPEAINKKWLVKTKPGI